MSFATLMLADHVALTPSILAGEQEHWRALKTDKYLRVHGTDGAVYALGDAATVSQVFSLSGKIRLGQALWLAITFIKLHLQLDLYFESFA